MSLRVKEALGLLSPPVILSYRGYGTGESVWFKGHVLDDRLLYRAEKEDKKRKNIKAMLSRYMSDPLPGMRVEIEFCGKKQVVETDSDGYFLTAFHFTPPLGDTGWIKARYTVLDKTDEPQENLICQDEVYIVDEACEYGIISDVDDTIIISYSTELFKKLRLVLTKNAQTRLPFPGISAFYHALRQGLNKQINNPLFFVSSSEWNLYDFLIQFCEYRNIPKGIFLLQDFKKNLWQLMRSGGGTHQHKLHKIRHLFETFPQLKFILIGDSGQRDAEIYAQVVHEFPGRVLAIYIRDVSREEKDVQVRKISDTLRARKVEMLLVADTLKAARHAFEKGLITESGLKKVEKDFMKNGK